MAESRDGNVRACVVEGENLVVGFVQPTPDWILLVGTRCYANGPEKNAFVVDFEGRVRRRFTLGDGIHDVRVAPSGKIWVSYFDEGVFGNYGWGSPDGREPIGAWGLAAFDADGERCWHYDGDAAGTESIDDCYALNVAGDDDVWLYFYSQFPIVHVQRGSYRVWRFGKGGSGAIAATDRRALLYGGWERRGLVRELDLRAAGIGAVVADHALVGPDGRPLEVDDVHGVGPQLVVFAGCRAYAVRMP